MKRRTFLIKSLSLAVATTFYEKAYASDNEYNRIIYSGEHLDEFTFKELYPKAFYQKPYFELAIMASTVIVVGAVTYFTAGAGAPAAPPIISSVASWIGGGGAGSYMAGLSTIGSMFGGNAILGHAILSGIYVATTSSAAGKASLMLAAKVAQVMTAGYIGIVFIPDKDGSGGSGLFNLRMPKEEIGSGTVRKLKNDLEEVEEKILDLSSDINDADDETEKKLLTQRLESLQKLQKSLYDDAIRLLKAELAKGLPSDENIDLVKFSPTQYLSPENLIILSIAAYKSGHYEYFTQGVAALKKSIDYMKVEKKSYVDYLEGVAALLKDSFDLDTSERKFRLAWKREPYTLEPPTALIFVLEQKAKQAKSPDEANTLLEEIELTASQALENYDEDEYASSVQPFGLLFGVATIFMKNKKYQKAIEYFDQSYDELGVIGKFLPTEGAKDTRNHILIMKAACLIQMGKKLEAQEIFEDIAEDYEDEPDKLKFFKKIYDDALSASNS